MTEFSYWLVLWSLLVIASSWLWPRPQFRQQLLVGSVFIALAGSLLTYTTMANQNVPDSDLHLLSKLVLVITLVIVVQVVLGSQTLARMDADYIVLDCLDRLRGLAIFLVLVQGVWCVVQKNLATIFFFAALLGLLLVHHRYRGKISIWLLHICNFALLVVVGIMLGYLK